MTDSPLAEATPTSLEEIFSSSPLERTPEELEKIVTVLREKRELWAKEELAGKKTPSSRKKLSAPAAAPKVVLSAEDFDF